NHEMSIPNEENCLFYAQRPVEIWISEGETSRKQAFVAAARNEGSPSQRSSLTRCCIKPSLSVQSRPISVGSSLPGWHINSTTLPGIDSSQRTKNSGSSTQTGVVMPASQSFPGKPWPS